MDTAVARPTTWRRVRNTLYLKYRLGKAECLGLANYSLRVSRSHALSYAIRTK
jgi:hypothetical protein